MMDSMNDEKLKPFKLHPFMSDSFCEANINNKILKLAVNVMFAPNVSRISCVAMLDALCSNQKNSKAGIPHVRSWLQPGNADLYGMFAYSVDAIISARPAIAR
jgi:hypothetical protein